MKKTSIDYKNKILKTSMRLFRDTYNPDNAPETSLYYPWQDISIISSSCPVHIGTRLEKIGDNRFKCPRGLEVYQSSGSVANQHKKDRYDLSITL